ncbi:MAG: hypothetical protein ACK4ZJ_16335, partial [Allorhizobium sp.]
RILQCVRHAVVEATGARALACLSLNLAPLRRALRNEARRCEAAVLAGLAGWLTAVVGAVHTDVQRAAELLQQPVTDCASLRAILA